MADRPTRTAVLAARRTAVRATPSDPAPLMGLGVLERCDGHAPQPFLSARLAPEDGARDHDVLLLTFVAPGTHRGLGPVPEHALALAGPPAPAPGGGLAARWLPADGGGAAAGTIAGGGAAAVDVRLRPVLPSDAAWLSALGFAGRPSIAILEELAARTAAGRDRAEEVVALALPRLAPHAVAYRVGTGAEAAVWLRGPRGWVPAAVAARVPTERLRTVASLARATPWHRGRVGADGPVDARALLGPGAAALPLRAWGVDAALDRIGRPPVDHDEVAFTALASDPTAVLDRGVLGPDLAALVDAVGRHAEAAAAARAQLFGEADPDDGDPADAGDPDGPDAAGDPLALFAPGAIDHRILDLAARAGGSGITAAELVELLDLFDARCDRYDDLIATADGAAATMPREWLLDDADAA